MTPKFPRDRDFHAGCLSRGAVIPSGGWRRLFASNQIFASRLRASSSSRIVSDGKRTIEPRRAAVFIDFQKGRAMSRVCRIVSFGVLTINHRVSDRVSRSDATVNKYAIPLVGVLVRRVSHIGINAFGSRVSNSGVSAFGRHHRFARTPTNSPYSGFAALAVLNAVMVHVPEFRS